MPQDCPDRQRPPPAAPGCLGCAGGASLLTFSLRSNPTPRYGLFRAVRTKKAQDAAPLYLALLSRCCSQYIATFSSSAVISLRQSCNRPLEAKGTVWRLPHPPMPRPSRRALLLLPLLVAAAVAEPANDSSSSNAAPAGSTWATAPASSEQDLLKWALCKCLPRCPATMPLKLASVAVEEASPDVSCSTAQPPSMARPGPAQPGPPPQRPSRLYCPACPPTLPGCLPAYW